EGSDGRAAPGLKGVEEGALGRDGGPGVRVVEHGEQSSGRVVVDAALAREGSLAGSGQHLDRVEDLGGLVRATQAEQTGAGQHDGVELTAGHPADPGVDVAAQLGDLDAEAERVELTDAARAAGADARTA